MNGRKDPRTPEERAAIARGMKRSWEARRAKVSGLEAHVEGLAARLDRVRQVITRAEVALRRLKTENASLKKRLGIKERRDEVASDLAEVERLIRKEMGEPAQNSFALQQLYGRRRTLEDRVARLDAGMQR